MASIAVSTLAASSVGRSAMNDVCGNGGSWLERASSLPVAFAQVREDALLDREVVRSIGKGARVAMVASGGCTAALLASMEGVGRLLVVDPNPAQLALTGLKLRLLESTGPEERLAVLGHAPMAPVDRRARLGRRTGGARPPARRLGVDLVDLSDRPRSWRPLRAPVRGIARSVARLIGAAGGAPVAR